MKQLKKFLVFILVTAIGLVILEIALNRLFGFSLAPYLEKIAEFKL